MTSILAQFRVAGLFLLTAFFEILGCYLFFLVLNQNKAWWLIVFAVLSLFVFASLLTIHPTAAGRTYAAYGGVYILSSLLWLWLIEGQRPSFTDLLGTGISLIGMLIILFGIRSRG